VTASKQHDLGWIARNKMDRKEHEREHSPQNGDRYQNAANGVSDYGALSSSSSHRVPR
jgi:hypothetical protein